MTELPSFLKDNVSLHVHLAPSSYIHLSLNICVISTSRLKISFNLAHLLKTEILKKIYFLHGILPHLFLIMCSLLEMERFSWTFVLKISIKLVYM
jgi:hypothetical protein